VHLLFDPAADKKVGNTIRTFQVLSDIIFKIGSVGIGRMAIIFGGFQHHPDYGGCGGTRGADDGFVHIFRIRRHFIQLVGNPEQGFVHIGSNAEFKGDGPLVVE